MSTIRANRNGESREFSKSVWDNMPDDKYGWQQAAEVPEEVLNLQNAIGADDAGPLLTIPEPTDRTITNTVEYAGENGNRKVLASEVITDPNAFLATEYTSPSADQITNISQGNLGSVEQTIHPQVPGEQINTDLPPIVPAEVHAENKVKEETAASGAITADVAPKAPVKKAKNAQADK